SRSEQVGPPLCPVEIPLLSGSRVGKPEHAVPESPGPVPIRRRGPFPRLRIRVEGEALPDLSGRVVDSNHHAVDGLGPELPAHNVLLITTYLQSPVRDASKQWSAKRSKCSTTALGCSSGR